MQEELWNALPEQKAAGEKGISLMELSRLVDTSNTDLAVNPSFVNNTSTTISFERLQQGELLDSSGHRGTIVPFEEPSSFRFNAANNLRINEFLASTLFLLHRPVVSPVLRNMGRDIANGFSRVSHYTGGFFSRNLANINTNAEEQEALLLHDEAKP